MPALAQNPFITSGEVHVWVPGDPAPQGSKRHVGNGVMIESSRRVKPWRQDVREAILEQREQQIVGAVRVWLNFVMPRPKSTPKRLPTPPARRRPDLDKLVRAVLDAVVSAGLIEDDACVIELHATKNLAELGQPTGCHLTVREVGTS